MEHRRAEENDWFKGSPKTMNWYLTAHLNGKAIYRYWLGDAWSDPVTTDTYLPEFEMKPSEMSFIVSQFKVLNLVPDFLTPFTQKASCLL